MLFFTQCFGAVLDLIHLRFQHYKAKRVFSAAGQLVCVVNPTHNLKVSCCLSFHIPAARVPVLSPRWSVISPRAPGAPGEGSLASAAMCLVPGGVASAPSRFLGVSCSRWRHVVFPLAGTNGVRVQSLSPELSA